MSRLGTESRKVNENEVAGAWFKRRDQRRERFNQGSSQKLSSCSSSFVFLVHNLYVLSKISLKPLIHISFEMKRNLSLIQEIEDKESELKRQEETRKQLVLKLCNMQKHVETTDYKLKKLEGEHEKAIKTIQGFMERQQQLENTKLRKEQKIMELEIELNRLRECESLKASRDGHNQFVRRDFSTDMTDDPERDPSTQVDIMIFRLCMLVSTFLKNHMVFKICSLGLKLSFEIVSKFFISLVGI